VVYLIAYRLCIIHHRSDIYITFLHFVNQCCVYIWMPLYTYIKYIYKCLIFAMCLHGLGENMGTPSCCSLLRFFRNCKDTNILGNYSFFMVRKILKEQQCLPISKHQRWLMEEGSKDFCNLALSFLLWGKLPPKGVFCWNSYRQGHLMAVAYSVIRGDEWHVCIYLLGFLKMDPHVGCMCACMFVPLSVCVLCFMAKIMSAIIHLSFFD
jgi:hypothetical protein